VGNPIPIHGKSDPDARGKRPALSDRGLRDLTDLFKSLADRSRLQILFLLAEHGELNVTAIGAELRQSQPAVSHHLNQLKKVGLIAYRRDGKFNFYRLDPDGLAPLAATLFPNGADPRLTLGGLEVEFRGK
jgi:ArsR family transcriptional regulator